MTAREAIIDSMRGMPVLITLDGVARALSVSRRTVERYIAEGRLASVKLTGSQTGSRRVPKAALEAFLLEGL